jgi:hypothetical protein
MMDVFVSKLNSTGTGLIYSTFIGGSSMDRGNGIAVDASGNAYIVGNTQSNDYDVTAGAFQTVFAGGGDAFVTKLNSTGTGLIYSTYMGGSSNDIGRAIAINGSGNAYITGSTLSTDYPVTTGVFQNTNAGSNDVFVTKLNGAGSGLIYSTYIGGNDAEQGQAIAVDGSGNAYVTGYTFSADYDVTPSAFQTTIGGQSDVFVTKIDNTGNSLMYSTYLGGSNYEEGYAITIDGTGKAYVTGSTSSSDFDVTAGAFQTTFGGAMMYS